MIFLFCLLFLTRGGWLPSDIRLDTGDSPGAGESGLVQLSCSGSNVYALWADMRDGNVDVYFNYSTDSGATWQSSDIRLDTGDTPGANSSENCEISCSSGNVYAVWHDDRNGTFDIYFNCSIDRGKTWMTPDVRLDTGDLPGAYFSGLSQVACSEKRVYVVWQDNRDGFFDIYFNTAAIPTPNIKANGSDGPITITQGDTLSITVELDAGILIGEDADWWILMRTDNPPPNKWLCFDLPTKSWLVGRDVTLQRSLFDVSSKTVPKTSGLAPGTYVFYFATDMDMNGVIDVGKAYYDKVKVTITP